MSKFRACDFFALRARGAKIWDFCHRLSTVLGACAASAIGLFVNGPNRTPKRLVEALEKVKASCSRTKRALTTRTARCRHSARPKLTLTASRKRPFIGRHVACDQDYYTEALNRPSIGAGVAVKVGKTNIQLTARMKAGSRLVRCELPEE